MVKISVIMPVLNEAGAVPLSLASLQPARRAGHELIVVDGGSSDASAEIASRYADRVLSAPASRAGQMNEGARRATGELLLFLHADTLLPDGWFEYVEAAHAESGQWGWFDVCLDNPAWVYRLIAACMNRRARVTKVCTGDQAMFLRRELFDQVGGFPPQPLMEDVALSKRLRRLGRPRVIAERVVTASRRWEARGVASTILLMWDLRLRYFLGQSPESLHARYYPRREES